MRSVLLNLSLFPMIRLGSIIQWKIMLTEAKCPKMKFKYIHGWMQHWGSWLTWYLNVPHKILYICIYKYFATLVSYFSCIPLRLKKWHQKLGEEMQGCLLHLFILIVEVVILFAMQVSSTLLQFFYFAFSCVSSLFSFLSFSKFRWLTSGKQLHALFEQLYCPSFLLSFSEVN